MTGLKRLLAKGLFPKELPPAFRTTQFAQVLDGVRYAPPFPNKVVTEVGQHSLARAGGVRRMLGIPNPMAYLKLAGEMASDWRAIRQHTARSTSSASRPLLRGNTLGRAAGPVHRFSSLPRLRVQARRHGRYALLADIAEFYRTVYTHSIPWALHSKAVGSAPQNHNNRKLLGVRIDQALRNAQRKQTNGIPIGPDTSFIIGEIILAAVDHGLEAIGRPLSSFRFYDDYEIVFERASDAEDYLAGMHGVLAQYNLQLNSVKTRIMPLPLPMDNPWRDPIRRFELAGEGSDLHNNIIGYFDHVFEQKAKYPADPVVNYAVSRLDGSNWNDESWRTTEALLFQSMSVEPDAMQQIAIAFAKAHSSGLRISQDDLTKSLTLAIRRHSAQGHGFEVAWLLWMVLSFGSRVDDPQAIAALSSMSDSVVCLLALDAFQRDLLPGLDLTQWESFMSADQLEGEHWLLSYEASVRGWLGSFGGGDHIGNHGFFAFLRRNKVNFYSRVRTPTQSSISKVPTWRPDYGDKDELDVLLAHLDHKL